MPITGNLNKYKCFWNDSSPQQDILGFSLNEIKIFNENTEKAGLFLHMLFSNPRSQVPTVGTNADRIVDVILSC